jgi:arylformamidase
MHCLDLSHPISEGMPVWPGSTSPEFTPLATVSRDGFAERLFSMSSHTGTHLDAPSHMLEEGLTLDRYELSRFFGSGMLLDLPEISGREGEPSKGRPDREEFSGIDFVLFRTGWSRFWGYEAYDREYPVLGAETVDLLCSLQLKGVGIDCPSFDRPDSTGFPVHRKLLGHGFLLIENLTNLHLLPHSGFALAVFPLPVRDAEACPVRAVALT